MGQRVAVKTIKCDVTAQAFLQETTVMTWVQDFLWCSVSIFLITQQEKWASQRRMWSVHFSQWISDFLLSVIFIYSIFLFPGSCSTKTWCDFWASFSTKGFTLSRSSWQRYREHRVFYLCQSNCVNSNQSDQQQGEILQTCHKLKQKFNTFSWRNCRFSVIIQSGM